jgi:Rad3-related DNA helicase
LYLVGTHRLADEAKQRLPEGVTSAIWQGRAAEKLGTDGEPMCLNPAAVEAAIKIGAEVEKTACRKAKRGAATIYCPFFAFCHYQAQKTLAEQADVVFAAHEILLKVPTAIGKFGLIVVDEAFWQDALFGTAPKSRLVISSMADELIEAPVRDYFGNKLNEETDDLAGLIHRLQGALDKMPTAM